MKFKFSFIAISSLTLLAACGGGGAAAPAAGAAPAVGVAASCLPAGAIEPASVHAALVKSYNLTFSKSGGAGCGANCTFAEGGSVTAAVAADGKLTIGALVLSTPFYRKYGGVANTAEAIWIDCANNIEYALSDNSIPVFNEINVGDTTKPQAGGAGIPGLIGQMR